MPDFPPELLASWTGGRWTAQPVSSLLGFTIDTRQLRAGQVFVAIKTDKRDGHDFLPAAHAAYASAAIVATANPALTLPQLVVDDPLTAFQTIAREHRRRFGGRVVGISGSAGKTSTKNLLARLLATRGGVLATEGNLNNHLGVPLTLTRLDPSKHEFAVIEAGISAPREMAVLASMIEPDVAIITLIAAAHTAELGGLGGVAAEKAVLAGAVRENGIAIFTRASAEFAAFREIKAMRMIVESEEPTRSPEAAEQTVTFSVHQEAESTALLINYAPGSSHRFALRRVSDGMARNAVLAVCAALWLGVPASDIQNGLLGWEPAKLRGELRRDDGRLLYLDCYNANPASMADALDAFYAVAPADQPRLFILGGMEELGSESEMFHRALGRTLRLRPQDFLVVVGDEATAVRLGALDNGSRAEQMEVASSLDTMAQRVAGWKGAVFIKGSRRYELEKVLRSETAEMHA
jgi:UDP-N-acetylmuramoyl-tripeptide--D-alanyl-D-alanine ligase